MSLGDFKLRHARRVEAVKAAGVVQHRRVAALAHVGQLLLGQVMAVLDRDTLLVKQGKKPVKVRLYEIDAPENIFDVGLGTEVLPFDSRWSAHQLMPAGRHFAQMLQDLPAPA